MSDMPRMKGLAGRTHRNPLPAGPAVGDPPNLLRERQYRSPVKSPEGAARDVARTTPGESEPGPEHAIAGGARGEPDDAELEVTIRVALCSAYSPLRAVVVVVTSGRVLLIGRIPSFFLKQVAQEAARRVPGVAGFENRLVVERTTVTTKQPDDTPGSTHPDTASGAARPSLDTRSTR
jgi:hypothetical protein